MKVSVNWLKEYLKIDISPEELVKGLVNIGFDVDNVENQADKLKNFVIGKVIERKKHPNADKLSVCKVDAGTGEILNVVCGAPNVDAGQTVCVALVGAIIPNGEFEIKKSKIRGEFSEGMICSAYELNISDEREGIMVLEDRVPVGRPFAEYLGQDDVIIDIDITPNRSDLLSHFGVGREAGFLLNRKINIPDVTVKESNENINDHIKVEIENPKGCYRYCGRLVQNVKVKESPAWMKKYLTAAGLRPINNIVDITNFVMLECGQPLHAFDYDLIKGKKIIVKNSGKLKSFTTLDGKARTLNSDILLICDAEKPVALAGIMGGENSEITDNTQTVFIESAYFDPIITRRSSKLLGLQTDSSYRFERGIDIEKTEWACNRAAELMSKYADGKIFKGLIDNYPNKVNKNIIGLRIKFLNKISGIEFTSEHVKELLEKIEIKFIEEKDERLYFEIPYFRIHDLQREIDLVEEVVRLNGYENIPDAEYDSIYFDIKDFQDKKNRFFNDLRKHFVSRGYKEIITNSIINEKYAKVFDDRYITLLNPLTAEMNVMRTNLSVGALEVIKNNFNFKARSLKLFELGSIMYYEDSPENYIPGIKEKACINLVLAGEHDMEAVNQKLRQFDVFDMKGEVQMLLEKFNIDYYNLNYYNYTENYEYRIDFELRDRVIASVFQFSDRVLKFFDIENTVIGCELYIEDLARFQEQARAYKEISKFPPVLRDLSIVADKNVKVADIEEQIKRASNKLLKKVRLYDLYRFEGDESNKLSLTFSLEFSSNEKTLTDEEVNLVQEKIVQYLNKNLKAQLRS
ncbi:MAG: phenylalanine--tRNA ligase subunit beta [Ignavibacteria bacterium]|jgi:phenylalanyl-tRNA synthetase beta chain